MRPLSNRLLICFLATLSPQLSSLALGESRGSDDIEMEISAPSLETRIEEPRPSVDVTPTPLKPRLAPAIDLKQPTQAPEEVLPKAVVPARVNETEQPPAPAPESEPESVVADAPTAEEATTPATPETRADEPQGTDSQMAPEETLPAPSPDSTEIPETVSKTNTAKPLEMPGGEDPLTALEFISPNEPARKKSFVLLDAEIAPGTATRLAWTPSANIRGLALPTPVLVINGAHEGKTLCLTAAIHGDELNGIEVVRRVMYAIEPEKLNGQLIGVPIVNLQGFQRNSRYLPDRRDLNRFFPGDPYGSLASRIAASLYRDVLAQCDALIDIHTGSLRRNNLPQVRADMRQPHVAEFTEGFDDMAVVQSAGSPGMLRWALVQRGIPAVTLEIGESMRIDEDQIEAGVHGVNGVLDKQGLYSRSFIWGEPDPVYYQSFWVRSERGGMLFSKIDLGDRIRVGQVIGIVTDPITNESTPILSPYDGRLIGMAVDQVVMPGFAAYHIGVETTEETLMENYTPPSMDEDPSDPNASVTLPQKSRSIESEPGEADES